MTASDAPRLVRFPNGFELLLVPAGGAPVLALELWVRAGGACERPAEAGMAHFVEHMLFKGTRRRPAGALAREVEGVGGDVNAYTSHDHTVYSLTVAARFADLAVDLLSDAVLCSSFAPEEIEREKAVVLEEIRRSLDLPHHVLSNLLFAEAYREHPYGRPILGTEGSVASFERGRCLAFTRRWYRPGSMTLVAAGEADFQHLERLVASTFGRGGPARPAPRRATRRETLPRAFRACLEERDVQEVYFDLAFPGPAAGAGDVAAVDLLMAILGQGESSRLQHRVKLDRNLVRTVGASTFAPLDRGLLSVGGLADPALFAEAYEAVLEEVFRLRAEPVGLRELLRAKDNLEADFLYQKETAQGHAQKAGFFHVVLGDAAREADYVAAVRRADAQSLREAARRYLSARRGVLAVVHPPGALPWAPAEAAALTAAVEAREGRERPPRGRRRRRAQRVTLPNGARLLVQVNPGVPIFAARAALLGGTRREEPHEAGLFHLMASSMLHGTRSRSVFDIAHEADDLSGELDTFAGRNSFGVKGEFLSRYAEDGLDLLADVLCHPSFPPEEVEKAREDALGALRLRADDPAFLALRAFEEALYGDHPYGRDVLGTPETTARLPAARVAALHAAAVRPENLAVAVAGDVDPDLVFEFFTHALEHLRPRGTLPPEPPPPVRPAGPRRGRHAAKTEQVHLVVGSLGTSATSPDRFALRVANAVLGGQGGRLFVRLRDELGLAYAVSSLGVEGLDRGYVAAHLATSPANAEAALRRLHAELDALARGDIGAEEVEEAQRKLVGGYEIALQENAFLAAQLALDEVYGLGCRGLDAYARSVLAVTRDQVMAAARRYFDPAGRVEVVLGGG